jgi:hypothetical protein
VEALERRVTPANYTWISHIGGIWDDPANWLGGQPQDVPKVGVADIDFLATALPQTILLGPDDIKFQASSLTVEGGSYTLIGPGADANQPFTLSAGATLSAKNNGSLTFGVPFSQGGPLNNSLALFFLGSTTATGTGSVVINNQVNDYQHGGLSQFTVSAGTVVLGSSTAMVQSLFAINAGATLVVPSGSMPSIGSLTGGGNVQIGDVALMPDQAGLFINTPSGRTDTLTGSFVLGQSAVDPDGGGFIQMNGPGSLTVGSIDPNADGNLRIDVAGGALYVAHVANAETLSVAAQAVFGGPGASTFSGPAAFAANSVFSVALNGTGAAQFSTLTGNFPVVPPPAVAVDGANLAVSVGYSPTPGDSFTIIAAPNGSIVGQFANAPDGSTITPTNSPLPFGVTYNGNANGGVASLTLTAMAFATSTSVALDKLSTNPSTYGQKITFDAQVAVNGGGPPNPAGTVTFYDGKPSAGGTPIGAPQALVGGRASISTSALAASTHAIYAVYNPSSIVFAGSTSLPLGQTVLQATPKITWASPAPIIYGTALGPVQLDATASVPGSFAYTPSAGTILHAGNNQTLSVTFTPTDAIDYTSASAMTTINVNQAVPTLKWPSPAAITYGTALGPAQLDATASVAGSFAYSPPAGTILHAGQSQPLSVMFTPTDVIDYTSASAMTTISVNQAVPTLNWPSPAAITYGTALGPAQLDATASVPGSFAYKPSAGTILRAGNNQTLSVIFTPTDFIDYTNAGAMTTISVNQATPTLNWPSPAAITYGTALGPAQLDATASVAGSFAYVPPAGTVLHAGQSQPLSVTFTPTDVIDYTSASAKTTISVNQAVPTLNWPSPAAITYGTPLGLAQLDATASVAGSFAYMPPAGTVLHAGQSQPLSVTFTPTDAIDYTTASAMTTISVNQATPTLNRPSPAAITYGTALGPAQLDATASVPGSFAYTPSAGAILHAGNNQTLSVIFTPTDSTDYTNASAMTTINVNQAVPVLTWPSPAPISYGTALGPDQLDAAASVAGSFAYSPGTGTVLHAGNSQSLSVAFTPTDPMDYTDASAVTTISVQRATPAVTWASPAPIAAGTALGRTQLNATASTPGSFVYSPAAGTVLRLGNNQPLSVSFTPADPSDYTIEIAYTRITVVPSTTVVGLASSSADPSTMGQSVTFRAVVAIIGCGSSALSGTVAFYDGKPGAGGIAIGSAQAVTGGQASITTAALAAGTHAIYAVYRADPGTGKVYTSAPLSQVVIGARVHSKAIAHFWRRTPSRSSFR